MIYNIYGLVSPINGEIVYVGVTSHSIKYRVNQHYWHLNEVDYGRRNNNKRFQYLKSILPLKVTGKLLKVIDTETSVLSVTFWEKYYIDKYRKLNPDLLNETNGGRGGNTHKYKSEEDVKEVCNKISKALKGKRKTKAFCENLSISRSGLGNPSAKKLDNPIYAVNCISKKKIRKVFYYAFEIEDFLHKKGAWSNIKRAINRLDGKNENDLDFRVCYGYYWLTEKYANNYDFM